jgi:tetratricopeptide (TPR) repeat protein
MSRRTIPLALMLLLFVAQTAHASWYDDYDAGVAAAGKGNWSTVITKMTAAIAGNKNENNKARTYGAIFINYHPYYYRGIAYLNSGKYEQAIADLEKTSGPGELDLGPIGSHLDRAKRQLAAANETPEPVRPTPVPTQTVEPVRPTPVQPATPSIDPGLRQRAAAAIASTKQKLQAAQARRATGSPQYTQALNIFTDASTRNASARSNEDLNTVIQMADNAGDLADLATPPNTPAPVPSPVTPGIPSTSPITPKPIAAANAALEDHSEELKRALELYFAGEFEDAARDFETLTRKMPTNGWVWAFLGASQYSRYAFEADEAYRTAATKSFQKAKQLRNWKGGLPEKYFSKRIRQAFQNTAG